VGWPVGYQNTGTKAHNLGTLGLRVVARGSWELVTRWADGPPKFRKPRTALVAAPMPQMQEPEPQVWAARLGPTNWARHTTSTGSHDQLWPNWVSIHTHPPTKPNRINMGVTPVRLILIAMIRAELNQIRDISMWVGLAASLKRLPAATSQNMGNWLQRAAPMRWLTPR
jgi:hypothetical protein